MAGYGPWPGFKVNELRFSRFAVARVRLIRGAASTESSVEAPPGYDRHTGTVVLNLPSPRLQHLAICSLNALGGKVENKLSLICHEICTVRQYVLTPRKPQLSGRVTTPQIFGRD